MVAVFEVLLAVLEKDISTPASPANACVKEKRAGGMQAGWGWLSTSLLCHGTWVKILAGPTRPRLHVPAFAARVGTVCWHCGRCTVPCPRLARPRGRLPRAPSAAAKNQAGGYCTQQLLLSSLRLCH